MFKRIIILTTALFLIVATDTTLNAQTKNSKSQKTMTTEELKKTILGEWISITPEIRPSAAKNADGTLKPFYLSRTFTYMEGDKFQLDIINSADPFGKVPLVKISIKGHMTWEGAHPIAEGAQKVNFVADEAYDVTPLLPGLADAMNQVAVKGYNKWEINGTQSVLRKSFLPFGLAEGQLFAEFDLIYLHNDMMFWGARNIDGRGFDTEANRPTNLQIPMVRKH